MRIQNGAFDKPIFEKLVPRKYVNMTGANPNNPLRWEYNGETVQGIQKSLDHNRNLNSRQRSRLRVLRDNKANEPLQKVLDTMVKTSRVGKPIKKASGTNISRN